MRRTLAVVTILLAFTLTTQAGELQKAVKRDWEGAWVIATILTRSDCGGSYTSNRVDGNRISSSGSVEFDTGELGMVDRVDVKRERVDLSITLNVRTLHPYEDGPFTLYDARWCKVELEIALPRQVVKSKDRAAVNEKIEEVLEKYASAAKARASGSWNRREMEPYPEDYQRTLALHAAWEAEQTNAAVHSAMGEALVELARLTDRVRESEAYAAGFAEGVRDFDLEDLDSCSEMLSTDLGRIRVRAGKAKSEDEETPADTVHGYEDGQVFVYGIHLVRELPACYVEVPEVEESQSE